MPGGGSGAAAASPAAGLAAARADSGSAAAGAAASCATDVGPTIVIEDPKTVVVPRGYHDTNKKYSLKPHRIAVRVGVDKSFDGTGTLSASAEGERIKLFTERKGGKEKSLPLDLKAKEFKSGYTLYIQGVRPSGGFKSTVLKWELKGGSKNKKAAVTDKLTCVKLTLDLFKARNPDAPAAEPVKLAEDPKHDPGRYIRVQASDPLPRDAADPVPAPADKLPYERAQIIVRPVEPADWTGTLVVLPCRVDGKADASRLELFGEEIAAKSHVAKPSPHEIPHAARFAPVKLYVQGKIVSKDLLDAHVKLGVKSTTDSSGTVAEGDRACLTVLELELALCKSRTKKPKDANDFPASMSLEDKHKKGRFVHMQFAQHHGRAGVRVMAVKPAAFRGTLQVGVWNPATNAKSTAKLELFDAEVPAAGQTAKANPFDLTVDKDFQGKGFWAQGKAASGALRDAEVRLSLKDHINVGDSGKLTTVRFEELAADIPSTPALNNRGGNSPVDRHPFEHAKPPANASYDHDFVNNEPIVLIEDSIKSTDKAKLSVKITPAAAAKFVRWQANRDKRRTAPKGDHADIVSLPGNTMDPALVAQDAADKLKAEMTAGAVGSFHLHPYLDENGSGKFDFDDASGNRIDREPFLCLNLVLVRVQGVRNDSIAQPANASVVPAAPTSATGVRVKTGNWQPATTTAYSKATVKLTGGGENGLRGLDQVFAGWAQHIGPTGTSASAPLGLDIFAEYEHPGPIVPPALPPPPTTHRQFFIFTQSGPAGTVFGPGSAPVVEVAPVLDVTPLPSGLNGVGGNSCTGQWGGHGSKTPIAKTNKSIGQEWVVDTLDSPSVGHGAAHPHFPGTLTNFRFGIDFRVDLVVWTNKSKVAVNSAHPAARLYSSVQTNNWTVRFAIAFDPATGTPVGGVPAVRVVMNKDGAPRRRSTPVDGMGLETRFPLALNLFSRDATA